MRRTSGRRSMSRLRAPSPTLKRITPYDPRYLAAPYQMSANENPYDITGELRGAIDEALAQVPLNRYPDPLAKELRDAIAAAYGLAPEQVMVGNGGDELLFNLVLAWGGPGRHALVIPPTFSSYAADAIATRTELSEIALLEDFSLDEQALLSRLAEGDIDLVFITSPNNPTGKCVDAAFIAEMLQESDALVVVDEAYGEFCDKTAFPLLADHENLAILHTLSKAYALAGVRLGYLLAAPSVTSELTKIRQPYSVSAVDQAIGRAVFAHRDDFAAQTARIVADRDRVFQALTEMPNVTAYPSEANFVLFRLSEAFEAEEAWQALYEKGILVRDFSRTPGLANCLRVTCGNPAESDAFLAALGAFLEGGAS